MKRLYRLYKDEEAAVLVIVAVSITLMMGLGALVLDVGYLYYNRRNLQNAADSSALASVVELGTDQVESSAKDYAEFHGVPRDNVAVYPSNAEVTVEVNNTYPRFLGVVFGSDRYAVAAKATARIQQGFANVMPFAPMPKNYTEPIEEGDFEHEAILTEEDFTVLQQRPLEDYLDFYSSKEARLEDFKDGSITEEVVYGVGGEEGLPISIGIITGTHNDTKDGQNRGLLNLFGDGQASADDLEKWITGQVVFGPGSIWDLSSSSGAMTKLFQSNYDSGYSAIEYFLHESGGEFFIILPHPSIYITSHTQIKWGDYLIAEVHVCSEATEDFTKIGNHTSDKYTLFGQIVGVYNPLNEDDVATLYVKDAVRRIPFLVK